METIKKKNQLEMKDILIEIKNNLQDINSTVIKPRIKLMIFNVKKPKIPNQNSKKKKYI